MKTCCRCSDSRGHCSCPFRLRSQSHRPVHHSRAVCHLRESAEVLFTEPINSLFSRIHSTISSFTRITRAIVSSSSSDLQPHDQPIIDEPITNGATQEVVQLSDIEQLCENVTNAEKHTPDEKEHLHLRIHHDVLNQQPVTVYSSLLPFLDQDKIAHCQQHIHAMF